MDRFGITLAGGALTALSWVYLWLAHGRFWEIRTLPPAKQVPPRAVRVAAIIPARNEAATIGSSLLSLLEQSGSASLQLFVVDDGSTDGTAQAARQAAATAGRSAQLTVVEGRTPPAGWSGKLWALWQGIEKARELNPDFLLLTDADIVHAPGEVAALLEMADEGHYDLVSVMVKLHSQNFAEKLLIPAFVFFFLKLYPPRWVADPHRATAGAAGGCILLRPAMLTRSGGLEAIRSEIIDDCALARAVKRSGGRLWLGLAETSASIRPYGSFAEIRRMIARSAFSQLRHSILILIAALAGLAIVYLLPPILLFSAAAGPIALGAFAWLVMARCYWPMVRFYRLHPFWSLTLPLAAVFYMGATVVSAVNFWSGRGGEWKGRMQDRTETAKGSKA